MLEAMVMSERNGKRFWTKVGMAFPKHGGGYTVRLEAMPLNGTIYLLPKRERAHEVNKQHEDQPSQGGAYDEADYGDTKDAPF